MLRHSTLTATKHLNRCRVRHLPIVADGQLVGLVSIGDLVHHRLKEIQLENGVLRDLHLSRG